MVSELNIKFNFRVTWIEVNSKTARRTSASNCRFRDEKEVPSPDILEATTYICAYLLPTTGPKERTSLDSLEENIVPRHRQLFLKTVITTQRSQKHKEKLSTSTGDALTISQPPYWRSHVKNMLPCARGNFPAKVYLQTAVNSDQMTTLYPPTEKVDPQRNVVALTTVNKRQKR